MSYWIIFNYKNDTIGACIDDKKVIRYWNKAKIEFELDKEYTYSQMRSFHPADIQMGILQVAGPEIANISNLRITDEKLTWEQIYGK